MRTRKYRKVVSVLMLVVFSAQMMMPAISYALTSGPSAPEFSSFEPVDTTDMVNLSSGDFVYNMPLLEVPGPEGGFPLSLSYHSGITLNEEASWVGLGWTLNPGAITRTVNGSPDDQIGAVRNVRDEDPGGERSIFSVGLGSPAVTYNVDFAFDSNLGFGIGSSIDANLPIPAFKGFQGTVGGNITLGPYGGVSAIPTAGISYSQLVGKTISTNVGLQTNFNSVSFRGSLGLGGSPSVGGSISSKGIASFNSVGGIQFNQVNGNAGRLTIEGSSFRIPIGLGPLASLGYKYLRYYSSEASDVSVVGSLHVNQANDKDPSDWSLDSYPLIDSDFFDGSLTRMDPEAQSGGSFPSYDFYAVNTQGISGNMLPYIFDNGTLFRQNLNRDNIDLIKYNKINNTFGFNRPVNFRFKNDFSNALSYSKNEMEVFEDGGIVFQNESSDVTPDEGYNVESQHLAGSRHIEWFTNSEINEGSSTSKGFMNYHDLTILPDRTNFLTYNVSEQAGGFMITNETGMTYHYALPVYAYDEKLRVQKIDNTDTFHEEDNLHPYAYTWLLTAVTGPDFVDRNSNGSVDETDWGSWVRFSYGKWSDNYRWRNPGLGSNIDLDNETEMVSHGKKQLLFLNEIATRTHSAYFLKSEREDAKGASDIAGEGRFTPFKAPIPPPGSQNFVTIAPATQLRLDKIILVKKEESQRLDLKTKMGGEALTTQFDDVMNDLVSISHRIVSFQFSYDLCQDTPNSFKLIRDDDGVVDTDQNLYVEKGGKLTLNSIQFEGKGGVGSLIPPVTFEYGKNRDYKMEHYDMWGFYKSDYSPIGLENVERYVTEASAEDVDTWSLTKVGTALGADMEIVYEPDRYRFPALYKSYPFPIRNFSIDEARPDKVGLVFDDRLSGEFPNFFKVGDQIRFIAYVQRPYVDVSTPCSIFSFDSINEEFVFDIETIDTRLWVNAPDLYSILREYQLSGGTSIDISAQDYEGPLIGNCPSGLTEVTRNFAGTFFVGGSVLIDDEFGKVGGGLRVKSIQLKTSNSTRLTKYDYNIPESDISSGVIAYEPSGLDIVNFNDNQFTLSPSKETFPVDAAEKLAEERLVFFENLHGNFSRLLSVSREIPAPGVIYEFVTVTEENSDEGIVTQIPGKEIFEFQTFEGQMIKRTPRKKDGSNIVVRCVIIDPDTGQEEPVNCSSTNPLPGKCYNQGGQVIDCDSDSEGIFEPVTFEDFTSSMTSLKSVSQYGSEDQLLSQTINHYLNTDLEIDQFKSELRSRFSDQGHVTQIFNEHRTVSNRDVYVFSRRDEYPLVPLGQTSTNYKTGVTTTSATKAFDFFSGAPVTVESTDSYGNTYLSVTEPAYKHYPQMGLKVIVPTNKHMLTQSGANYNYKLSSSSANAGLLSASVQTWSDQIPNLEAADLQDSIWRQHESYQWNGQQALNTDGTYPMADFNTFNFEDLTANAKWERTGGITLYDAYSHALEATDINSNFASTRMDPKDRFVTASTSNASYYEMVYSGIEFSSGNIVSEGDVSRGNGSPTTARAHTGKYSLLTGFNKMGFNYTLTSERASLEKPYRASVWVYVPGEAETQPELDKIKLVATTIDGLDYEVHPTLQKSKSKSWYLMNLDFDPQGQETVIKCVNGSSRGVYFDDFRVHPLDASMTSYVYDSFSSELNFILDANNLYTRFEYDAMGRLTRTSREMLNFDFGPGKESFKADRIINEVIYNYGKSN